MEIQDTALDFNKICRLCLSEETVMSSIYNETDSISNSAPLPLRIMACVSVEISSTDGLPSQICASCLCQVDGWYKFKDLCENADSILRKYVKNEPVQVEAVSHIQNMAQEIKKYFTVSQNVEEEGNGPSQSQSDSLVSKKRLKTIANAKGQGNRHYSLSKCGTGASSHVSKLKMEDGDVDPCGDVDYEKDGFSDGDGINDNDGDGDNDDDNKTEHGEAYRYHVSSSENRVAAGSAKELNEILTNRIRDSDDLSECSSDENMSLSEKKKLLKSKAKTRRKAPARKEETPDAKPARTIQTQTGTDDDFSPETVVVNGLDDTVTPLDKKKIKNRKTQTPREKSAPKKRFRIRPAVPSSCTLCDKVYKNSEILRQHMKSHHVTGTIECPNCKLTFTSLRSLKYHEQRKHSNLEPVPCTFCGKKFLDKKYLRIHENIHSQVNQYVCQFCGRKFIMKTNLTVHISRHHTLKTNDFICQVCGKAFPFKLYLKKHFKTHTDYKPYQCSYCEAKFRENTLLRKHVNSIHLKLRPFLCQYCHKTFTRSLYLREHMESQHLGIQKKIECARCGENFQNRNRLRQHECEGRLEVL